MDGLISLVRSRLPPAVFQLVYATEIRMEFELLSELMEVETFAANRGIRNLKLLNKKYGFARWRKRKGVALVRLPDGTQCLAELHWYEATGKGRKEMKVKWILG
jgi:hypothetical protein